MGAEVYWSTRLNESSELVTSRLSDVSTGRNHVGQVGTQDPMKRDDLDRGVVPVARIRLEPNEWYALLDYGTAAGTGNVPSRGFECGPGMQDISIVLTEASDDRDASLGQRESFLSRRYYAFAFVGSLLTLRRNHGYTYSCPAGVAAATPRGATTARTLLDPP